MQILARLGLKSAGSMTETVDSTTDSVIVGRLPLLNMFNILNPLLTIAISGIDIFVSLTLQNSLKLSFC